MALSRKSLAGPSYIILNAIRVMNIIGLLAVIAASVVMLVKTSTSSKFFFFDAVSHVLTCITGSKSFNSLPLLLSKHMLTADSVSPGFRDVPLPRLLRSQLAAAQSSPWLRHARALHGSSRHQPAR